MIGLQTIGYARPRQLLINNDFQVNQRGESSYAEGEYTIDMWFAENGMVGVTNNGIVFTRVWQKLDVLKDSNYVFVYKIHNGDVFHINILSNNGTYQDEQLKITLLTNETHTKITIESISGTQFNRCNYFDLFEGDIAYPHQKEDYAIALLRCRQYLTKGRIFALPYGYKGNNIFYFRQMYLMSIKMKSTPTINYITIDVTNIGSLDSSKIKSIPISDEYVGGIIQVDLGKSDIDSTAYVKYPMYLYFILSCEPKP